MDDRLAAIQAARERLAADRPYLTKAVADARIRCAAVILDAVATVERCRSAQLRRAAHRNGGDFRSAMRPDGGGNDTH